MFDMPLTVDDIIYVQTVSPNTYSMPNYNENCPDYVHTVVAADGTAYIDTDFNEGIKWISPSLTLELDPSFTGFPASKEMRYRVYASDGHTLLKEVTFFINVEEPCAVTLTPTSADLILYDVLARTRSPFEGKGIGFSHNPTSCGTLAWVVTTTTTCLGLDPIPLVSVQRSTLSPDTMLMMWTTAPSSPVTPTICEISAVVEVRVLLGTVAVTSFTREVKTTIVECPAMVWPASGLSTTITSTPNRSYTIGSS